MFRDFMKKLLNSRGVRYIIVGGCTTLFNFLLFGLLCHVCGVEVNISNFISVVCSILFAYVTNKIFVFASHCRNLKELLQEFLKFVGARLFTMVVEVGGVYLLYSVIGQNEYLAKIETQIIVLIVNYLISRFLVFKSDNEKTAED